MDRRKIRWRIGFYICLAAVLLYGGSHSITAMIGNAATQKNITAKKAVENIYALSFELSSNPFGRINTYVPYDEEVGQNIAETYAGYFGLSHLVEESEEHFLFADDNRRLYVSKQINQLRYEQSESSKEKHSQEKLSGDRAALRHVDAFIENHLLTLNYEEAIVTFDGESYGIQLVHTLGNLKNFGYPERLRLDSYGNVLSMDYSYRSYRPLDNTKIKSEKEAFYELPLIEGFNTQIFIHSCRLVYHVQNAILQPAYLFEGETNLGEHFEAFVDAVALH